MDGGATWTSQFSQNGTFYFNEIDCAAGDPNTCCAAAESSGSAAPGIHIYCTANGQDWKQVRLPLLVVVALWACLRFVGVCWGVATLLLLGGLGVFWVVFTHARRLNPAVGRPSGRPGAFLLAPGQTFFMASEKGHSYTLMGLEFTSATEAWACGGSIGLFTKPMFLHTTDGGASWTNVPGNADLAGSICLGLDMISPTVGYAAVDNVGRQTASVAKFSTDAPIPPPAPPAPPVPPPPGQNHYGDPNAGSCLPDEKAVQVCCPAGRLRLDLVPVTCSCGVPPAGRRGARLPPPLPAITAVSAARASRPASNAEVIAASFFWFLNPRRPTTTPCRRSRAFRVASAPRGAPSRLRARPTSRTARRPRRRARCRSAAGSPRSAR